MPLLVLYVRETAGGFVLHENNPTNAYVKDYVFRNFWDRDECHALLERLRMRAEEARSPNHHIEDLHDSVSPPSCGSLEALCIGTRGSLILWQASLWLAVGV